MIAASILVVACAAASEAGDALEAARAGFASPRDAERRAAASALLRELAPADVDAALDAVQGWPPTASMLLRETLAASGRARATLLERATRAATDAPARGALARALLVDAFVARAAATAPFLPESRPGGDEGWPLTDRGVWFARPADARVGWSWFELDDALDRDGSLERLLVPTADCADALVAAPVAARMPAEGWLGVAAERASLRCVPLAIGAWLVSAARAEPLAAAQDGRGDRMPARALELEAGLLGQELLAAARCGDVRRGVVAGDLLRRVGLAVGDDEVGRGGAIEAAFASGLALVRAAAGAAPVPAIDATTALDPVVAAFLRIARARSAPLPAVPARDETRGPPPAIDEAARALAAAPVPSQRDPAALRDRPAAEVRAIVARAVELTRGHSERAGELATTLRAVVDAIVGRCAEDPLLGGQLVEIVRREAGAQTTHDDERRALEAGARELWALDRGTRPPTRLVLLPSGPAR
jgi:hypothetical protein